MKNNRIKILVVTINLVLLFLIGLFIVKLINNRNNGDFELIGGIKDNEVCLEALEPLYVDGKEVCSLNCISSNTYSILFDNGDKYTLKEALDKKLVTVKELQEKGLPCY